ncbi:hypothetical protein [Halostagnicola sp. A-GB9-2]|uniref:hypothetical protein n=1 Tax=Halostagnicola sp. A-GB9-2 TaxID=3048066 RepID=UPI0024C0096A|nr:hypothetical protein [Halostagnicola sp. A-GB9-2]MDJ1433916.1 hypothetical protein [Halostagnicola sp. A-GB9-2]
MSSASSMVGRILTPRVALFANVGLVVTGSVLGLLGLIDPVSGILIVVIGFLGVLASLSGYREE